MDCKSHHFLHRSGWLRAAVFGANDGIVSIASLLVGIAAAESSTSAILTAGIAGAVAGAMSMAAGEYVSVSSQADIEKADLKREAHEIKHNHQNELHELRNIYVDRGLTPELALQVAEQLMNHGALEAHARDELGLHEFTKARPLLAAWSSGLSFTLGSTLPILVSAISPPSWQIPAVTISSLAALAILGAIAAFSGRAPIFSGVIRVLSWGAAAMMLTAIIGKMFNYLLQ